MNELIKVFYVSSQDDLLKWILWKAFITAFVTNFPIVHFIELM